MSKFIGIDVSKETFDAAFPQSEDKMHSLVLSNQEKGFKQLVRHLQPGDHCVMEASGPYYVRLATYLHQQGLKVSVVNPLVIRRFAQMRMVRAKTDRKDARVIYDYAVSENPALWQPDDEAVTRLRQLQMVMEGLSKQQTMLNNQMEALRQLPLVDSTARSAIQKALGTIGKQIEKMEQQMLQIVKQSYQETFQALKSIPCIGNKSAVLLIAITNNFKNFETSKQLCADVGLSPRVYHSGTSIRGKGHICKMGMSLVRKVLYVCSWTAKSYNLQCKQMYERLKAKGKPERVIKIAVANKLLKMAFAVGKNLTPYEKNYKPKLVF